MKGMLIGLIKYYDNMRLLNVISYLLLAVSLLSCANKSTILIKNSNQVNRISENVIFNYRVLPDNLWYLDLNPDLTYKFKYFSGFTTGVVIIEEGVYELESSKLKLKPIGQDSDLLEETFILILNNEIRESHNYILDRKEKYCLINK